MQGPTGPAGPPGSNGGGGGMAMPVSNLGILYGSMIKMVFLNFRAHLVLQALKVPFLAFWLLPTLLLIYSGPQGMPGSKGLTGEPVRTLQKIFDNFCIQKF